MAENFQRLGSESNAQVGRSFEEAAIRALAESGLYVTKNYPVDVGVGRRKKRRNFDLGSDDPPILVECKSHRWTAPAGNVPSAKMTVWNEAMFYFSCAPTRYRQILFVLRDLRPTTDEALSEYYVRTYSHLIPRDVEIWELNETTNETRLVHETFRQQVGA